MIFEDRQATTCPGRERSRLSQGGGQAPTLTRHRGVRNSEGAFPAIMPGVNMCEPLKATASWHDRAEVCIPHPHRLDGGVQTE
jgi:hypothetical protein